MLEFVTIILFAFLNRMRGDDSWMRGASINGEQAPQWLPGRSLYYVAIAIGAWALWFLPWQAAILFGLTYLVWGVMAWGRWFDLGRLPDGFGRQDIRPDAYEKMVESLGGENDHASFFLRQLMVLPGLLALSWWLDSWFIASWTIPFSILVVGAYEFAWRDKPEAAIPMAEWMTGVTWGLLLMAVRLESAVPH